MQSEQVMLTQNVTKSNVTNLVTFVVGTTKNSNYSFRFAL